MPTKHQNLITAAKNGHAAVVTALLEKGADPKAKNNDGETALIWAARNGHAAVVTVLLEAGANPNTPNQYGNTALIWAAAGGHAAVVTALVLAGADLEAKDKYGYTPLIWAADKGHEAVVTALLEKGADPKEKNQNGDTALICAASRGHAAVVTVLLEAEADPKAKNNDGETALIWAARNGHAAVVTVLLEAGANPNTPNQYRNTALIWAAAKGHAAVVTDLLDRGADPEAKSNMGNTALIIAASWGHAAVVTALLDRGADPKEKNQNGDTALIWAADNDHAGIVSEIEKYIESGEYEWRQYLPYLRKAAREHNHPTRQSSAEGAAPEPEPKLVGEKPASIESIANRVIAAFLKEISIPLPQKKLALAKLLNDKLSKDSPVINPDVDLFPIIGTMLARKPKRIDPGTMENFAKIMAALSALEKYKGNRPDVAREIIVKIIKLTERGEIFSSKGDFVGIDEVIQTLSGDNYAEVFKTTNLWGLTKLQEVISDVSEILGGESYPDPGSFVKLKKKLDPKREEGVRIWKEMEIKIRKKTNHPSIQFGWTDSLFDNPYDNKIYNLDEKAAAEPEPAAPAPAHS